MYVCIHCLYPTSKAVSSKGEENEEYHGGTLYKRYGNDTIKLSDCWRCHNYIDEYCEREWLLVILDMILFRPQAYRHVLLNRWKQQQEERQLLAPTTTNTIPRIVPYLSVSSAFLRAHVGVVATQDQVSIEQTLWAMLQFLQLAAISWIAYILQIFIIWIVIRRLIIGNTSSSSDNNHNQYPTMDIVVEISLAILLPATLIHGWTAFLFLWEISETILRLATGLMISYNCIATWTILQKESIIIMQYHCPDTKFNNTNQTNVWLSSSSCILTAVLFMGLSILVRLVFLDCTTNVPLPCPGMKWTVFNKQICLA